MSPPRPIPLQKTSAWPRWPQTCAVDCLSRRRGGDAPKSTKATQAERLTSSALVPGKPIPDHGNESNYQYGSISGKLFGRDPPAGTKREKCLRHWTVCGFKALEKASWLGRALRAAGGRTL